MKKIKIILALMLSIFLLTTGILAQETEFDIPEKVEIAFNVGDDVLIINGEEVTTETAPYVVETASGGVTLVPVRVITEAFGAKVDWEESTQTVTLSYPDVEIMLQIGNTVAEVNGEAVTLLTSPELPGGRTMVPLRFISETFGAEVAYDEETGMITVTKGSAEQGETIRGGIDEEYIGDSKYDWMMINPASFEMSSRRDDGSYTSFRDDNYNSISISILEISEAFSDEEFDFEEYFLDIKRSTGNSMTLSKADKDSENKTITICGRTIETYSCKKVFVTDKYIYTVTYTADYEDEKSREYLEELASSFKTGFEKEGVHNLYTVPDEDERLYKSETLNFELTLPEVFKTASSGKQMNYFKFNAAESGSISSAELTIISNSEAVMTPKEYLEHFKNSMTEGADAKLLKVSEIETVKMFESETEVWALDYTISGSLHGYKDKSVKHLGFVMGDYTYRIRIDVDADDNPEEVIAEFLDGMKFAQIDPDKAGVMMDSLEKPEEKDDYTSRFGMLSVDVPSFLNEEGDGQYINYSCDFNKLYLELYFYIKPLSTTAKDAMMNELLDCEDYFWEDGYEYTVSDVEEIKLGNNDFLKASVDVHVKENATCTICLYLYEKDGYIYIFSLEPDEMYYSYAVETTEGILASVKPYEKPVEKAE